MEREIGRDTQHTPSECGAPPPVPAVRHWAPLAELADDSPLAGLLAGLRVLLVEDAPDPQRIYLAVLRRAGADVSLECNGYAAVNAATAAPAFDAVVLKTVVVLDGLNATRELRQRGFPGPILVLSQTSDPGIRQAWLTAGSSAYLVEPVSAAMLIAAILRLVYSNLAI